MKKKHYLHSMYIFNTNALEMVEVYFKDLTQRSNNYVLGAFTDRFQHFFQSLKLKRNYSFTAAFHSHVD